MSVIVVSKTGLNVTQYDNVTAINKNSTTGLITISYSTSSTAVVNPATQNMFVIKI